MKGVINREKAVSLIKMDIEGAEENAIIGLKETIVRHHSTTCIETVLYAVPV